MANSDDSGRAAILRAIKSPIGFFALVVLSAEALLGILALQLEKADASVLAFVMAGILGLTVVCVLTIALQSSSRGLLSGESQDVVPQKQSNQNLASLSDYEVLREKITAYAQSHGSARVQFRRGQMFIKKGDVAETIFLLEDGNVLVDDESGRPELEQELKHPGTIIGEAAVLGEGRRRTASVYVHSATASLIEMSRREVRDLADFDPAFRKALGYLFELHANRLEKIALYCGPGVASNAERCTVVMGDIHGFSRLSERVTDEMACPFRFKFTEQSMLAANSLDGHFEDQGDGFKIFFRGEKQIDNALSCAMRVQESFGSLVDEFAKHDRSFMLAGLGIGISTGQFAVLTKPDGTEKILGHAVNIAAAMCKLRAEVSERKIYCTAEVAISVKDARWEFTEPYLTEFEKLEAREKICALRVG